MPKLPSIEVLVEVWQRRHRRDRSRLCPGCSQVPSAHTRPKYFVPVRIPCDQLPCRLRGTPSKKLRNALPEWESDSLQVSDSALVLHFDVVAEHGHDRSKGT